ENDDGKVSLSDLIQKFGGSGTTTALLDAANSFFDIYDRIPKFSSVSTLNIGSLSLNDNGVNPLTLSGGLTNVAANVIAAPPTSISAQLAGVAVAGGDRPDIWQASLASKAGLGTGSEG